MRRLLRPTGAGPMGLAGFPCHLRRFFSFRVQILIFCLLLSASLTSLSSNFETNDVLVLTDGRQLEGRVLQPEFGFRTPYAQLVLKKQWISELRFQEANLSGGFHTVVADNGDRLTGLFEGDRLTILSNGHEKTIRREEISSVRFAPPPNATPPMQSQAKNARCLQLRNGDSLAANFEATQLRLTTSGRELDFNIPDLITLEFSRTDPASATATLRDGRTVQGRLTGQDLQFNLAFGPRLAIHQQSILSITQLGSRTQSPHETPGSKPPPTHARLESMVWVSPGEFLMGSPAEEPGRDPDEGPQTRVIMPKGFWIAQCEVTQAEYQKLVDTNPSHAAGESNRPIEKVTWFEAAEYCEKLNVQEQSRGRLPEGFAYRLPTEAEWEYACRAGTQTRFSYGDDRNDTGLEDHAWFARNSESMTHPVGRRCPNSWGLYDMHGNVWEWCLDRWDAKFPGGSVTNTAIPARGNLRVARGGSWLYEAKSCRSANRDEYAPGNRCSDLGFRVVLAPLE